MQIACEGFFLRLSEYGYIQSESNHGDEHEGRCDHECVHLVLLQYRYDDGHGHNHEDHVYDDDHGGQYGNARGDDGGDDG